MGEKGNARASADPWEEPGWKGGGPKDWAESHEEVEVRALTDALVRDGTMTGEQAGRFMDQFRSAKRGR